MSYHPRFYGDVTTSTAILASSFEIGDILVRGKWIKADSFASSQLYSNLQLVKAAKELAFYATSEAMGQSQKILRDFLAQQTRFNFHIVAFFDEFNDQGQSMRTLYSARLECTGCRLLKGLTVGSNESYWLELTDATASQHSRVGSTYGGHHPGHGHRHSTYNDYGQAYGYGRYYDYGRYHGLPTRHRHGHHF